MRGFLTYVLCSLLLGFSINMPAQNIPALQKDASITQGALPNGISYYLVTNSTMKGFADFALVRKGMADTLVARNELASLPHFNKTIPYKFLSRKGIGCRPEGFISYRDSATLYRFDNVPMFDVAAADTTLLMMFDIIALQPAPHAVIVSGDINPAAIIEKMKVFSLMVPSRTISFKPATYSWVPSEETSWSFTPSETSSVEVDFRSPRTPAAQLNTIQPFISSLFSRELGEVVKRRLKESLISRNITVKSLSTESSGSCDTSGDEHFVVKLEMPEDQLIPATMALSSTLAEIGSKGVVEDEYMTVRGDALKSLSAPSTNDEMVIQCVSNYLFGADLATSATKAKYFISKSRSVSSEVQLFNNYVSALLGEVENATVRWTGSEEEYDEWIYQMMFRSTWNGVSMLDKPTYKWTVSAKDTLDFIPEKGKTKLKSSSPEPMSGGEMWTFANGMRVLYKKMPSTGRFFYSMMIKGGSSTLRDLPRGEGAFFPDMMELHKIADLPAGNFGKVLKANDVEMKTTVTASDLRLSGSAPSNRYSLVLKALLSIANDRKADPTVFEPYRKMELSLLPHAVLDSLMFPDNIYTDVKTPSGLTPTTLVDAEEFFSKSFLRCNDGVIVLVGDLPSEALQKYLTKALGGFRLSKSVVPRSSATLNLRSGLTTYTRDGKEASVSIGLAAERPFSTENAMALKAAGIVIGRRLSGVVSELGFHVDLQDNFITFPKEVVDLRFILTPVPECGLPAGVQSGESNLDQVLLLARKTIDEVLQAPVNAAELASIKALLLNNYTVSLADPSQFADAVLMRYSSGKDVLTRYNEKINGITADTVKEIFGALAGGMRVEYVVRPQE